MPPGPSGHPDAVTRRLIVNADDYGLTAGVSAGIRQAQRAGIVTTATVLANLPAAQAEVARALEQAPALGLGVHLNLTLGAPLQPAARVPSLVDAEGRFRTRAELFADPEDLDPEQVEFEWRAQIEALTSWGVQPDHLDSHHHAAALAAPLWEICLRLARELGCGVRRPWPSDEDAATLTEAYSPEARRFATGPALEALRAAGVPAPDAFYAGFYGQGATRAHLMALIDGLPEGTSEIMCHPGQADEELQARSGYAAARAGELAVLADAGLRRAVADAGVRLATFRQALGAAA